MAESPLRVELDREEPAYRPGETIAGRVVVEPDKDVTYRRVIVERKIRTRGKGDTDEAREHEVVVDEGETTVRSGDRRVYDFVLPAPEGPATFSGEWVALDWVVEGRLDVRLRQDPRARAHFTLEPDDALAAARAGPADAEPPALRWTATAELPDTVREALDRYPDAPWIAPTMEGTPDVQISEGGKKAAGLAFKIIGGCLAIPVVLILVIAVIVGVVRLTEGRWVDAFGAFAFAVLFVGIPLGMGNAFSRGALMRWVKRRFAQRRLGQVKLKLETDELRRGEDLVWFLRFKPRRAIDVKAVRASLVLEEWVTYTTRSRSSSSSPGSSSVQTSHTLHEIPVALDEPRHIDGGEDVVVPGRFRLPAGWPGSFHTFHNQLRWGLKVDVDVRDWPDYQRTAPLDVA